MRSYLHTWFPVLAVIPCCLACGCLLPMGDRAAPARSSDLPGVWVGRDQHHWGSIYRLELRSDGSGLLGIKTTDLTPPHTHLYEVSSWKVDDGAFSCALSQISPAYHSVPLRIRGSAMLPAFLNLELNEPGSFARWEPGPDMVPEAVFLNDLEKTRGFVEKLGQTMRNHSLGESVDIR